MGQARTTGTFNAPIETVFKVITDYAAYPEFMSDVKRTSIIESSKDKKLVEFEIQIVKAFRYQLWLMEAPHNEVTWKFHTGDLFKENNGGWKLTSAGANKTNVEYSISAKFGIFVPGMIEKKIIEVNLPSMMDSFKKRIESL